MKDYILKVTTASFAGSQKFWMFDSVKGAREFLAKIIKHGRMPIKSAAIYEKTWEMKK